MPTRLRQAPKPGLHTGHSSVKNIDPRHHQKQIPAPNQNCFAVFLFVRDLLLGFAAGFHIQRINHFRYHQLKYMPHPLGQLHQIVH